MAIVADLPGCANPQVTLSGDVRALQEITGQIEEKINLAFRRNPLVEKIPCVSPARPDSVIDDINDSLMSIHNRLVTVRAILDIELLKL